MLRVKRRTFSGCVCEQEVYHISAKAKNIGKAEPTIRFENEEERAIHRVEISRRNHTRLFNENFSPKALYSTLTIDDFHEVHDFRDADRIAANYMRRLRYKYPDAVIFLYMGRGKSTERIHFHMVSLGIPAEYIGQKWKCGEIKRIVNLRAHNTYKGVDHGQDYTGLANYLFNHWTEEQGGHRWKMTRNAKRPEREEATVALREYNEKKPPRAPKGYILVESKKTKYGYFYFKYIIDPKKKKADREARWKCLVDV